MASQRIRRFRRALRDPATRPSALNLGVGLVYALLGLLVYLVVTLVGGDAGFVTDGMALWSLYAFVFALFYLGSSYSYHWHAKYTFERASRSFVLGTLGGALGLCGLVVQPAFPAVGLALSASGIVSNVLGSSWGTFVYTYRTYAPS